MLAAALLGVAGAFTLGGLFLLKAMVAADADGAGAGDSSSGLVAAEPADRAVPPGAVAGLPELAVEPMLGPPAEGETRGEIVLPSGAASALAWAAVERELRLSVVLSGGRFDRAFLLADPPRVVFDLEGAEPDRSYGLDPKGPFLKRVRVGGQRGTTRVVVDLVRWPADSTEDGEAVILSF